MGRNRSTTPWLLHTRARTKKLQIRQTNYQAGTMSYFRTPELRARQSQAIQSWQPWKKSTGPKSDVGKAKVSRNAVKHGDRSADTLAELQALRALLAECKQRVASGAG